VPTALAAQARARGLLEVLIDEQGRVIGLTVRMSIHPMYDPLLVSSARDWRYKPAMVDGVPVKFRKLIQVSVDKR
jgi:TonB family protein